MYGIFYKKGRRWVGPYEGYTYSSKRFAKAMLPVVAKQVKKCVQLKKQSWASI
jgi:hypothetical protein